MNNSSLQRENMWVALIWVFVFMVVLVWDQEKIVVLNLILFCYFLYYMLATSIDENLQLKASSIREALSQNLNLKLSTLNMFLTDSTAFIKALSGLIKTLLKKINSLAARLVLSCINPNGAGWVLLTAFAASNFMLNVYAEESTSLVGQQYLFASNFICTFYNKVLSAETY